MEDRGVSPRGQAVDGDRGLPVPGFSHPAQPHSVRITGVESSEGSGLPNRADHLPDQARLAARLPRPTTQESHGSNGSCVSPTDIKELEGLAQNGDGQWDRRRGSTLPRSPELSPLDYLRYPL